MELSCISGLAVANAVGFMKGLEFLSGSQRRIKTEDTTRYRRARRLCDGFGRVAGSYKVMVRKGGKKGKKVGGEIWAGGRRGHTARTFQRILWWEIPTDTTPRTHFGRQSGHARVGREGKHAVRVPSGQGWTMLDALSRQGTCNSA